MGIREDVLALADELDGVSIKEDCDACLASGTELCRGDLECSESAHKACAKRLREIVEHDAGEVTTVSAYDLLPEDEREAIAWVREHGGLGAVEKRLMPEGMEWPKVDGEPVDFKTGYEPSLGVLEAVSIYNNGACEVMSHDGIVKNATEIHVSKPKVLDADGVEIKPGDTVCGTRDMEPMRVADTDSDECGFKKIKCEKEGDGFWFYCPDELTHELPVLAADGKPLRVGETVYKVGGDGTAYVFDGMSDNVDGLAMLHHDGKPYIGTGLRAEQLTHEQPDTWERLEADAEGGAKDYCAERGLAVDGCAYGKAKAADLVRRCRALAERERSE